MSETLSGDADPPERHPPGGWIAPLFVVVLVALLASGVFSSDPEPDPAMSAVAITPVGVTDDPGAADAALVDDQDDFVEFGFDSQFGIVPPRSEPAAPVPALRPGETERPVQQM